MTEYYVSYTVLQCSLHSSLNS